MLIHPLLSLSSLSCRKVIGSILSSFFSSTTHPPTHPPSPPSHKTFRIEVKRGWKAGTQIHFGASRDGSFPPTSFILAEAPHRYFTRRGDDLVWRRGLSKAQVGRWVEEPTHPLTHNVQHRVPTASFSSTQPTHPPTYLPTHQAHKDILVKVPLLNGTEAKVSVKAGSVPPTGGVLTLREKGGGMPKKVRQASTHPPTTPTHPPTYPPQDGSYGDLIVELFVER